MEATGAQGPGLSGTLRLTWVTDHLAHVLDNSATDETTGTWTCLACLDHGLKIGSDVDNTTLLRLSGHAEIADLVWEAANCQVLELMQNAGLTRFSPAKPQRWVTASFEHHTSPHGLPHPHIHNIVIPALTTS
jgi:hypothetical protein